MSHMNQTHSTSNPTLSVPTVSFEWEHRIVSNSMNEALVTMTISDHDGPDLERMSVVMDADILVMPTMSDGTEHVISLDRSEHVRFSTTDDDFGLVVTKSTGMQWVIDGYARVTMG